MAHGDEVFVASDEYGHTLRITARQAFQQSRPHGYDVRVEGPGSWLSLSAEDIARLATALLAEVNFYAGGLRP